MRTGKNKKPKVKIHKKRKVKIHAFLQLWDELDWDVWR